MSVIIDKAESKRELKKFIDLPHDLYKGDANYVPELFIAQKKLFDKKKNPFFKHAEAEFFIARKDGVNTGRIAVISNGNYKKFTGNNDCFFGFFDATDFETAKTLLDRATAFARENGYDKIIGPVNFSTNDTCGVLMEGFDLPPVIMMTYNKTDYNKFLEEAGFKKMIDLIAYRLITAEVNDKTVRIRNALEERLRRSGITIRNLSLRKFEEEVERIRYIYNSAWEKNWGFVPMTEEEFNFAAADMKSIVDPDFAFIAEHSGNPIGFSLSIPNLNEIFINIPRGRLFPTGIFKLLMNKNKVKTLRVLTLGVLEAYRKSGVDACFYARSIEAARRKNIRWSEASWILENNEMMNRALVNMGGEPYKKYRIYERNLS
ncbi:MAG TPA: hypothetical protein VI757_05900 [Bacteroidia bacterium]|nr:hypothetical protein [Bacteroidia bacterium]